MTASVLDQLRHARAFMRTTAAVVVLTFSGLITAPTAAAIRTAPDTPPGHTVSAERQLSNTVRQIRSRLGLLADKLSKGKSHANERAELAQLNSALSKLARDVRKGFERTERLVAKKGLPEVIAERQNTAVVEFEAMLTLVQETLETIENAPSAEARLEAVEGLKNLLDDMQLKRKRQPFDPEAQLPHYTQEPQKANKPRESELKFLSSGTLDNPLMQVAALGEFSFDNLVDASNPAYLDETVEVKLTTAIKDKAAELDHDPVKIYHWVRNNIEWLPSWGAVQDADVTLSAQRGNAMDIASLTIALLRASGIPARYVHGTIDVSPDEFRNWAGGFDDLNAAMNYAASGGIPVTAIRSGGTIASVRMEHVWVEAALDFLPSRAAINREADSWVAMGPSFKQYDYQEGLDVVEISGLDPEALSQSFLDSGSVNEAEGWVQGFDSTVVESAQQQAQTALEEHISNNMNDPTVGDVVGGRKVILKEYPGVPSSLPNPIVVEGATYAELPEALQPKLTLGFGRDLFGDLVDRVTFPWAQANNHKVTLSFRPATEADEQALASLLPDGEITDISQLPQSIPSYLIEVVPEIKVNGEVKLTGSAMGLGEDLDFGFEVDDPVFGAKSYPSPVVAGSYLSIAVAGGSVSPKALEDVQSRLESTKATLESQDQALLAGLGRDDILGDMFHAGTLGYFAEYSTLAQLMAQQQDSHMQLAPSVGTYGYVPKVNYFFGFPRSIEPGGVEMDLDRVANATNVDGKGDEAGFNLTFQLGALSSALEHSIPEQMFVTEENPGEGVSAVKALQKASAQGQRIYHITHANQAEALENIHHSSETMNEIRQALAVGKEVITHTDSISVPGWSGAGYVIYDPEMGSGAWKIGGGMNGGGLFNAVGYIISVLNYFYGALNALAAHLGPAIPLLNKITQFLGIAKHIHGLLSNGVSCTSLEAVIWVVSLLAILSLIVVDLTLALTNPIAAYGAGVALDYASDWLINQSPDCS